ncbi:MAG: sigma-54 dependent transcriptional regulator [Syntrophales bacterium]|jgi:two-component system response regulator HydG|nr:sigma-54 dependent transcriptional regulator [Syntrophales bacterium]MCK9527164.1 sigma-54 dependent transcriptional regulator [Syntrophales bacterium]MDX9921711.1 sigma-54 dependent transcriptional regulator [Syntrophales bacterium]
MKNDRSILVVDDDRAHRTMLKTLLSRWGYTVEDADDGDVAISLVRERPWDLILMDVRMARLSGLEALPEIRSVNPSIPVIIMTAYSSVESAVDALKKGAYDYLTKPLDFDELRIVMERATEHRRLKEENTLLRQTLGAHFDSGSIVGRSALMKELLDTVSQVAPSDATVLITGESGTGKELVAGAIHFNSRRREGPFVKINCGALTETLLESELFGHEKGAFTGADRRKEGTFRHADGGSLFLDEVSDMTQAMQVKLLRVLQEREIVRVGGNEPVPVDVRIIAATNRDPRREVERGRLREDLFFRLNVIQITVPGLRDRREDIPLLAQRFLDDFAEKNRRPIKGFTPRAMDQLVKHSWPGNVRELMNVIERAVVLSRKDFIDTEDLSLLSCADRIVSSDSTPPVSLEELERRAILETLDAAGGNKSETARRLGITRRTLHKKLKKYGAMT